MSFRGPWSLGNLNLLDYFPPEPQYFAVNSETFHAIVNGRRPMKGGRGSIAPARNRRHLPLHKRLFHIDEGHLLTNGSYRRQATEKGRVGIREAGAVV